MLQLAKDKSNTCQFHPSVTDPRQLENILLNDLGINWVLLASAKTPFDVLATKNTDQNIIGKQESRVSARKREDATYASTPGTLALIERIAFLWSAVEQRATQCDCYFMAKTVRTPSDRFSTAFECFTFRSHGLYEMLVEALEHHDPDVQQEAAIRMCRSMTPIFAEPLARWLLRAGSRFEGMLCIATRAIINLHEGPQRSVAMTMLRCHQHQEVQLELLRSFVSVRHPAGSGLSPKL